MTIDDFKQYAKPNVSALFTNIPIDYLDEFRSLFAKHGIYFNIKYRGPRKNDGRFPTEQRRNCLKRTAKSFSVYKRY